jgi:hypothetical protein
MGLMAEQATHCWGRRRETVTSPGQRETVRERDRDEDSEKKNAETFDSSKSLQGKRPEATDGPFRGFDSPPGRF